MSLYGAMLTGIAGLNSDSQAMSIYSSNIANVNTIGYKGISAGFSTMLTSMFGAADNAGVRAVGQQNVTQQGLLQQASSSTDLGIAGAGFFVVSKSPTGTGGDFYTRAGNFTPDANGNLENGAGFFLQGWPVNSDGSLTNGNTLSSVNIGSLAGKAEATGNITLQENLQASSTIVNPYTFGSMSAVPPTQTPDFSRTVSVYDSQGGSQELTINYIKTDQNTWTYEVDYADTGKLDPQKIPQNSTMIAGGTLTFGTDGSLAGVSNTDILTGIDTPGTNISFNIPFDPTLSGLTTQPIAINVGTIGKTDGITQFDSPSTLLNSTVDGAIFGNVTGVTIDSNGFVTAQYSNGLTQKVYQLPLATFTNANGLTAISGDAYAESADSGSAVVNASNTGGTGQINGGALEGSTVDLATEFTNLITTQRAYSASARIITTADTMLQTLEQLPSQ